MGPSTARHALVFGASGLAGWAVVDQLLRNYPSQGTFARVTAFVNRPLDVVDSLWPVDTLSVTQPVFRLVSGVDLTQGSIADVTSLMDSKITDVETVTHVFYFAYKQNDDQELEFRENKSMIERAICALNVLAPQLEFVVVPSGTKAYGVHLEERLFEPPYKESMGSLPRREADRLFYYVLHDVLNEQSHDRPWTWCDVRPDLIIGFAPHGSVYNLAGHWATYLSLYAHVEGRNAEVPYPGSTAAYNARYTSSSSQIIAKFSIWASLNHKLTGGGQVFNISDRAAPCTMADIWPKIAGYFGLKGTGPSGDLNAQTPTEYIRKYQNVLQDSRIQANVTYKSEAVDLFAGYVLAFDRHMSIAKARKAGFADELDIVESWLASFDTMKKAGMIID